MCVDQCDVLDNILKIKSNSIGPDEIHPKFIKILLPKFIPYLTNITGLLGNPLNYPNTKIKQRIPTDIYSSVPL